MWKARVATSGTCSGPGRIDVSLGMATQVLPFEFRRPPGVLPKGVRRAVQERVMTRAVEMLQLAVQQEFETYQHRLEHRKVGHPLSTCGLSTSE